LLSSSRLTRRGSICAGSSTGISTVSKPQRLNCLKSRVLSLVNGDVKRKVLMPNLIAPLKLKKRRKESKAFGLQAAHSMIEDCHHENFSAGGDKKGIVCFQQQRPQKVGVARAVSNRTRDQSCHLRWP